MTITNNLIKVSRKLQIIIQFVNKIYKYHKPCQITLTNYISMQSNQHSGTNHLNPAIPILILTCQLGVFSTNKHLGGLVKVKGVAERKNTLFIM